jgi:hypothetical protein
VVKFVWAGRERVLPLLTLDLIVRLGAITDSRER